MFVNAQEFRRSPMIMNSSLTTEPIKSIHLMLIKLLEMLFRLCWDTLLGKDLNLFGMIYSGNKHVYFRWRKTGLRSKDVGEFQ